jgi:hypothetical protein
VSRSHDNGFPGLADLVNDAECFLCGEASVCLPFTGIHVTVGALQGQWRVMFHDMIRGALLIYLSQLQPFCHTLPEFLIRLREFLHH